MRTLSNQLLTLIRSVRTLVFFEIIRACGEVILNTEFSIDELFGQNFKMLNAIDAKGPVAFPKMAPSEKNPFVFGGKEDVRFDFSKGYFGIVGLAVVDLDVIEMGYGNLKFG